MWINYLELSNFRNYSNLRVDFSPKINILYGKNGQGKTNIIEALYFLSTGRSYRTKNSSEMIKYDNEDFEVAVKVIDENEYEEKEIRYVLNKNKKKKIYINGVSINKVSEMIGNLVIVIFSPESLYIIKGSPSQRRKLIDILISQISSVYLYDLQQYYKILKNKNKLLKEIRKNRSLYATLEIWNESLIKIGTKIIIKRMEIINLLENYVNSIQKDLTSETEDIKISYKSSFKLFGNSEDEVKQSYKEVVFSNIKKEIDNMSSIYGPHRDDLDIKMNGIDARSFCSQGQQRTLILAIKMAELKIIEKYVNKKGVFLLDDITSELDDERKKEIIRLLGGVQTFITTTDKNFFESLSVDKCRYYKIKNGNINYN